MLAIPELDSTRVDPGSNGGARKRSRRLALPALVASATGEQSYNLEIDCHDWTPAEVEQAFRAALALEAR